MGRINAGPIHLLAGRIHPDVSLGELADHPDNALGETKTRRPMTRPKLKWSYWEALINSQNIERHQAESDRQIADELCDLVSVCFQWIEDMGFIPEEIYLKRIDEKAPVFLSIIRRYQEKLGEAIEKAKEAEP